MLDGRSGDSEPVRVLFVDDSRLIRFAGRRFLGGEFDVLFAANGRQAWELLGSDPSIRVVITDLMMPEVDGVELIRRIRNASSERIRGLPVLVVTSVEERDGRRRALDAGATDLVPKPFSGSDLVDPTRQYLRRAAEQAEARPRTARLPNIEQTRGAFVNRLEQIESFHDRHGLDYAMLHIRLDNYEEIASRFGLNWAESMMRHLERAIAREVRTEDTVGRSDASVFSVILMSTPAAGAKRLRERLRHHLARNPAHFPGCTLEVRATFSIQTPTRDEGRPADATLRAGLARLDQPANVTRLADRVTA